VHITENGRAYPDYLVRYYRGARDPDRTPYADKRHAMMSIHRSPSQKTKPEGPTEIEDDDLDVVTMEAGLTGSDTSASTTNVSWEYQDNTGWMSYGDSQQAVLESFYKVFLRNKRPTTACKVHIQTDTWAYEVNLEDMVQTNLDHPGHRSRPVRRLEKS
jgi:hypothetical protein